MLRRSDTDPHTQATTERLNLLFRPIASYMRTTTRALEYVSDRVDHAAWTRMSAPLVDALPFVSAFDLVDRVTRAERASWEANMTAEYGEPVQVLDYVLGTSVVVPPVDVHYAVAAVVGPSAGALVHGRDVFRTPQRAAVIAKAVATGDVAAGLTTLLRNGQAAYVLYVPVHWRGGTRAGVLGLNIDTAVAFDEAVALAAGNLTYITVSDVGGDGTVTPVYALGTVGELDGVRAFVGAVQFVGVRWVVRVGPAAAAVAALRAAQMQRSVNEGVGVVIAVGVVVLVVMALARKLKSESSAADAAKNAAAAIELEARTSSQTKDRVISYARSRCVSGCGWVDGGGVQRDGDAQVCASRDAQPAARVCGVAGGVCGGAPARGARG